MSSEESMIEKIVGERAESRLWEFNVIDATGMEEIPIDEIQLGDDGDITAVKLREGYSYEQLKEWLELIAEDLIAILGEGSGSPPS